jgi:hypothetical protein
MFRKLLRLPPVFVRGSVFAATVVTLLAGGLYAAFWLPYRKPAEDLPLTLELVEDADHLPGQSSNSGEKRYWVDRETGVVRVPVEAAMRVIAARSAEPPPDAQPRIPTDAGSGRFVETRKTADADR